MKKIFLVGLIMLALSAGAFAAPAGFINYPSTGDSVKNNDLLSILVSARGATNENADFNVSLFDTTYWSNSAGAKTISVTTRKLYEVISPDQNSQGYVRTEGQNAPATGYDATTGIEGAGSFKISFCTTDGCNTGSYYSGWEKSVTDINIADINKNGGKFSYWAKTDRAYAVSNITVFSTGGCYYQTVNPLDENNVWKKITIDLNKFIGGAGCDTAFNHYISTWFEPATPNPIPADTNVWFDGAKIYDNTNCVAFDGNSAKTLDCGAITYTPTTSGNRFVDYNVFNTADGSDSFVSGGQVTVYSKTIQNNVLFPENKEVFKTNASFDVNTNITINSTDTNLSIFQKIYSSITQGTKTALLKTIKLLDILNPDQNSQGYARVEGQNAAATGYDSTIKKDGNGSFKISLVEGSGLYYSGWLKNFTDINISDINHNGGKLVFYARTDSDWVVSSFIIWLDDAGCYKQILSPFDSNNTWKLFSTDLNSGWIGCTDANYESLGAIGFEPATPNPVPKDTNVWFDGIRFIDNSACRDVNSANGGTGNCKTTIAAGISTSGNFYIDSNVYDIANGYDDLNSGEDYFTISNAPPDVNAVSYSDKNFNYVKGGSTQTFDFNVFDPDTNAFDILLDANYNTAKALGGTVIVQDANLAGTANLRCDSNNLASIVLCHLTATVPALDANRFLIFKVRDNHANSDWNSSTRSMGIDSTGPKTTHDANDYVWQTHDANVHFTCNDSTGSGCPALATSFRLDTNKLAGISWGPWQSYNDKNLLVLADGNWALDTNSVDVVGNIGDKNTVYILIDKTGPALDNNFMNVAQNAQISQGSTVIIMVDAADEFHDINSVTMTMQLPDASFSDFNLALFDKNTYKIEFSQTTIAGTYRIMSFNSTDSLGNTSTLGTNMYFVAGTPSGGSGLVVLGGGGGGSSTVINIPNCDLNLTYGQNCGANCIDNYFLFAPFDGQPKKEKYIIRTGCNLSSCSVLNLPENFSCRLDANNEAVIDFTYPDKGNLSDTLKSQIALTGKDGKQLYIDITRRVINLGAFFEIPSIDTTEMTFLEFDPLFKIDGHKIVGIRPFFPLLAIFAITFLTVFYFSKKG